MGQHGDIGPGSAISLGKLINLVQNYKYCLFSLFKNHWNSVSICDRTHRPVLVVLASFGNGLKHQSSCLLHAGDGGSPRVCLTFSVGFWQQLKEKGKFLTISAPCYGHFLFSLCL